MEQNKRRYICDPFLALEIGKKWLRGNTRPHVLIGRARQGFILIDPRLKGGHYCQIVAKLYRMQDLSSPLGK